MPANNNAAFEANSRIPGLGGFFPPPPPPPLSAEVLKQFTNSPLPPPPFPPVPIPQVGLSSIPGLGTDPSIAARSSTTEAAYQPPETQPNIPKSAGAVVSETSAHSEDGELSDGELDEDSIASEGQVSEGVNMGNTQSKQTGVPSEPSLSDDDGSVSSYNPPSASSADGIETPPAVSTNNQPSANGVSNSTIDLKERAKSALLALHPFNITFRDLVEEGIDADLLSRLYQELGINDTMSTKEGKMLQPRLTDTGPAQVGQSLTAQNAQSASPLPAMSAAEGAIKPTGTADAGAANAAVERKDRIAQLLALKAAKGAQSQSLANAPVAVGQVVQSTPATTKVVPQQSASSQTADVKIDSLNQEQVPKKKNKAQTDLVRAKMEALRQQALAKAQAQNNASTPSTPNAGATGNVGVSGTESSKTSQKRPLASDLFDELPPNKRPSMTKGSKNVSEDLVSDEEGEVSDVDMDLDGSSDLSQGEIREAELAPTGSRNAPISTTSTASAMSDSMTPTKEKVQDENWRAKNEQIARMRKQIAELEYRRKTKQGMLEQSQSPGPGTPTSAQKIAATLPATASPTSQLRNDLAAAGPSPSQLSSPSLKALGSASPSTPMTTAAARAEALRKRLIRRREIQAGLPLIDAEVERTRSRLAEIQKEAQRLEIEIQKGVEGRQALLRELENMGVDTDSTSVERMRLPELKAVRDEILESQQQPLVDGPTTSQVPVVSEPVDGPTTTQTPVVNESVETPTPANPFPQKHDSWASAAEGRRLYVGNLAYAIGEGELKNFFEAYPVESISVPINPRTNRHVGYAFVDLKSADHAQRAISELSGKVILERKVGIQLARKPQPAVNGNRRETAKPADLGVSNLISSEAVMQPEQRSETVPAEGQVAPFDGPASDASSMGSAMDESSDSEDEDEHAHTTIAGAADALAGAAASPRAPSVMAPSPLAESGPDEEMDDDSGSASMSDSASDSSDDYEPADAAMAEAHEDSQTVAAPVADVNMDGEYEPKDTPNGSEDPVLSISEPNAQDTIPDRENINELTETNIMTKSHELEQPNEDTSEPESHKQKFVPYDSILKSLRSYRFNPQFTNAIPGGYRSLTYSSKIDPRRFLCTTEAQGEVCQDPTCEDQHFAQMGLPDDKILVEMSAAPGMDRESRNRYVNGLKTVIADLRSRGVKDFEEVASELAAYRRRFEAEQDPLLAQPTAANGTDPTNIVEPTVSS